MNSYDLSRKWFDWCYANPDITRPAHTALYFFCVEHCNRLGWKEKFGLPTSMAKEAIGIHSYNTYIKTLNDLIGFGFIKMIQKSTNQYSSNIIALTSFDKETDKALDKALLYQNLTKHSTKHITKQSESTVQSTVQSIDSIIKQLTINKEQINNKQKEELIALVSEFTIQTNNTFDFKKSLIDMGVSNKIVMDWMKVRKTKKATNTETAFNAIVSEIVKTNLTPEECIKISVENNWSGFKSEWIKNNNQTQQHRKGLDVDWSKNPYA